MARRLFHSDLYVAQCACGRLPNLTIANLQGRPGHKFVCPQCGAETALQATPESAADSWNAAEVQFPGLVDAVPEPAMPA